MRLAIWLFALAACPSCGSSSDGATVDAAPSDCGLSDGALPDASPGVPMDGAPPDAPPLSDSPHGFQVTLRVVDEAGAPIPGATVDAQIATLVTDAAGEVLLNNVGEPMVVVIEGQGLLPEPVVVGRSHADRVLEVRMLSDMGGRRWVMHSGGDVMLGRRYESPDEGDPLLPADNIAGGARFVVDAVARAFAAAQFRVINLETVVTDDPDLGAYPQKRVVIQSRPEALAGVQALGADLAVLSNNHIRDFLDEGVKETMEALDAIGMPYMGASADATTPADEPFRFEMGGVRVGMLGWVTLDGSPINDGYPEDGDPVPVDLDPEDAWKYEARAWGFDGATWPEPWIVPVQARRIGTAWRIFDEKERELSDEEAAEVWRSLEAVYPELQDWVARRGHGGAAHWVTSEATDRIAALAEEVDLVIVQIHGGFEFQDVPSEFGSHVAHSAIDAGADIVIAHHPHVLQGVEWYKDGLIAYSLGNFVFDQDFFITFPSSFLRVVWEGDRVVEARFVPIEVAGYRPRPMADAAADRRALSVWEKSLLGAVADRDASGEIRMFLDGFVPEARPAQVRMRDSGMVLTDTPPAVETVTVQVPAGATVPLGYAGLIHARAGGADVLLGRDLFGWGGFEDMLADGEAGGGAHWKLASNDVALRVGSDAGKGLGYVALCRDDTLEGDAYVRAIARIPLPAHRLYLRGSDGISAPADGEASYSVRLLARMEGAGDPYLRLDFYESDGSTPSNGRVLGRLELPIDIPADGGWHALELPIPREALFDGPDRLGAVMPYVRLSPPDQGESTLAVDDLQVIEWRPALDGPDRYGAYEYLRNPGTSDLSVDLQAMPLRDP